MRLTPLLAALIVAGCRCSDGGSGTDASVPADSSPEPAPGEDGPAEPVYAVVEATGGTATALGGGRYSLILNGIVRASVGGLDAGAEEVGRACRGRGLRAELRHGPGLSASLLIASAEYWAGSASLEVSLPDGGALASPMANPVLKVGPCGP